MKHTRETDVLVVGAGPVGLFAALTLARRGLDVEIVDVQPHGSTQTYGMALHAATLRILEEYDLLDNVLDGARRVRRIDLFREGKRLRGIDLEAAGLHPPFLAAVGQKHLESVLTDALEAAGVRVRWKHRAAEIRQVGEKVHVRLDELEARLTGYAVAHGEGFVKRSHDLKASFVFGADGADSFVRRSQGIAFPEVGAPEDYAVFQFEKICGECDSLQLVESDGLAAVRWPFEENGCRWSFQLSGEGIPPEYLRAKDPNLVQRLDHTGTGSLDEERLRLLLAERAPWCPARITNDYWTYWVRFERRLAERFGNGRVWLAGDAAHTTAPAGVQSMNVGLLEARDLAGRMADVLAMKASEETLAEYDRNRRAEWSFLMGLTGGLEPAAGTDTELAEMRARLLSRLPASGEDLALIARELGFAIAGWSAREAETGTEAAAP